MIYERSCQINTILKTYQLHALFERVLMLVRDIGEVKVIRKHCVYALYFDGGL